MSLPSQYLPITDFEKTFVHIARDMKVIGYGRQKQLITGLWAMLLMEYPTMNVKGALLGALDSNTWEQERRKEMDLAKLIISKLEDFVLDQHTHPTNPCECSHCKLVSEIKILKEQLA